MAEIEQKMPRLISLMRREGIGGILISRVANFSWVTGGLGDSHIVITSDLGAVDLLILEDGSKYAIASISEMPRMQAEDLAGLGYQPRDFAWHESGRGDAIIKELAGSAALGSDSPREGFKNLETAIVDLRTPLTDNEILKYRWLCYESASAVEETCRALKPGMREREIEALASDALMRRGIRPTVLLIGTDERIKRFRHATPTNSATLRNYGMVNICARRGGLVAAVTRFVYFGPVPADLLARLEVAARINAGMQDATRPGLTSGQLLEEARRLYAANGYPEEWHEHHQGGAIGYAERDWVILPGDSRRVVDRQAFAYNPTVRGAKVEDTVLLLDGKIENLTATTNWPEISTELNGRVYPSPAILSL